MRAADPDITNTEAARQMGITRQSLGAHITRATREGWLRFEDPLARVEYELIPKVVKNLNQFLDKGDKTVTIETAKGTLFKAYQESKGITEAPTTVLALKIEHPTAPDGSEVKIVAGKVLGRPKYIEGDDAV